MDILIFSGQSNMQGQTECLPAINAAVTGAKEYRLHTDAFVNLQHPVGEDIERDGEVLLLGSHQGFGSLVPAFCRAYIQKNGREVVAIHVAKGNTSIDEWQPNTKRYACMIEKIRKGIDKAREKEEIGHIFFIWLQGESDAIKGTSSQAYLDYLRVLKDALKRDVGIEKFGVIQVGYFVSTCTWCASLDKRTERDEAIMHAQEQAVESDSDFVMLTKICPKLSQQAEFINPQADGHYNNAGMEIIGREAGEMSVNIFE